ncbi:hypothetical protein Aca07nite_53820 [Actinoplanes capillaceus]|uniref:Tetratricopeptide (TPR) repeat n=1 Tax=Actinoplanes campanulatus TaxID=113559 RepID=A0ABQ3WPG3_9ACTN|nr:hypothetical protein [Actinoplanes capillaceus]GID48107.1 hypothetical protein Aca07nite_53820 [Actinoplanes capillaceus]
MSFEDDEYWEDEYSEYSFMPSSAVMQEQHYTKRTVPDPVIPTRRRAGGADEAAAQRAKRTAFDGERPSWLNDPDFEPIDTSVDNLVGDDFDDVDFNRPELGVDFDKPDFPIIDPAARPDLRRGAAPQRRGPDRYDRAADERRDRRADDREPGRPSGGRSERRPDGRSDQRLDGRSDQRLDGRSDQRSERRDSRYAEPRYRDEAPGGRDGYERGYRDDWDDRRQPSRRDRDDRREPARADWNEPVRDDRRDPRADRAGSRGSRDPQDLRDTSDIRGARDARDPRDLQDPRGSREVRDTRDLRDSRAPRRGEGREAVRADWADPARREGGRSEWAEPSRDERRDSRPPRDDRRGRRAVEIGPDELWSNDGDLGREVAEPVLEDERPTAGRTIELGADEFWEEPAASRDNVTEIDPERRRGPASRNEPGRAAQTWDDENFGPIRPPGGRRPRRDEEEPRRAPAPRRDDLAVTGRSQVPAPGAEDPYEASRPDGERRGALPAGGDNRPALAPDQRPAARESADRQRPGTPAPDRARPGTQEPGDLRQPGTGNAGDPQRAEQRQRTTGPEADDGQRSAAWDADGQRLAGGAWANGPGTTASGVTGNETSGSGAGRAEDGRGQTGFGSAAPAQGGEVSAPVEAGRGVPPFAGEAAVRDGRDARPHPAESYPDVSGPAPAGTRGQAPSEPGGQVAAAGSGATEPSNADASREGNERRGESWRSKVVRLLPGQRRAAANNPTEPTADLTDRGRGPEGSAAVPAQAQEPRAYDAGQAPRDPAAERGQPAYGAAPGTERHGSGDQIRSGMDGGNQPAPGSGRDADRSGADNGRDADRSGPNDGRDADRSNSSNERGMSQPGSGTGHSADQPPAGHGPGGHRGEPGNRRGAGGEAGSDRLGAGDEETRDLRESGSWPAPGNETAGGNGPREDGPRVVRRAEPPVPPKVVSRTTPPPAPRVIKADPPVAPRVVAAPTPVPPARVIGPNGPQPAVEPARPAAGTDATQRPHDPAPAQWSGPDATSRGTVAPHDPATAQRGAAAPHDPAMTQRGGPDAAPRGGATPHDPATAQWAENAGVPGDPTGGRWGGPVDPRGAGAGAAWQTDNPYVTGEIRRPDEAQPEVPQQRSRRSPRAAHVFLAEGDGPWAIVPDEAQPPTGSRPVSPARPPVVPGAGAAGQPGTVPGGQQGVIPGGQPGTAPGGQQGAIPGGQPSPASAWPPAVRPDPSRPVSGGPVAPRPESAWPPAVQQGLDGDRQAWPVSGQQPPSAGWPTPPVGGSTPVRTGPRPSSPAGPNATPTGPTPSAAGQGGTGPNATTTGPTPLAPNPGGTGPNPAHAGPVPLAADQGGVRRPGPKAAPKAVPPPPGWTETRPAADGVAPPAATWREAGQPAASGERSDAAPPSTAWREDGRPGLTPRSPAPGLAGADQSGWNAATPISVPPVDKADGGQDRQAGPVPVPPVDGFGGPGRPTSPAAPGVARAQSLGDLPGVQGRGPGGSQDSRPVAQPGGRTEQPRAGQADVGSDGRSSDAVRRDGQPSGQPAGRDGAPAGQTIPGGTQAGQANPGATQAGQANPGATPSEPARNASSGPIAGGTTGGRPTVALPQPAAGTDHGDTAARERIGFPLTRPGQAGPDAAQPGPEGAQPGPEGAQTGPEALRAHAEAAPAQSRTDAAPARPTAEGDRAAVPVQPEKDRADMVRDWADIDQPYMDADGALHNLRPIARLETSGPDTEPRRYSDSALGSGWFVSKTPAKTEDASGADDAAEATPEEAKPAEGEAAGAAGTTAEDEQPPGPELAPHLPLTAADLSAIRWRLDGASLREVVDDRSALRELGERLDGPLADEADNIVKAGLLSVRAEVYRLLGELGMAAAAARLALAHAESAQDLQSQVIAQAELAHVLRLRGDYMEADRLFQRAVDADVPAAVRSVVHENAGRSCFDQNRHMEALDHFARAIRLGSPEDTDLVERIGVCLEAVYIHVLRDGWGPYPRKSPEIRAPLGARPAAEGEEALTESTAEHPVVDPRR